MTSLLQDFSAATAAIATRFAPSLVSVSGRRARATGFALKPGLIVTADDALPEDGDITVTFGDGSNETAAIVGRDATTDVAVLKVQRTDLASVALAAETPPLGTLALALGHDGDGPMLAFGAVSVSRGAWRSMRGGEIDARIEFDLRLRRAGEGGLAVDASERVIGMTVFGPRRRVLVIPSATIQRVASQLETHGHIPRGYLGLGLQTVAVAGGTGTGAMVVSVDPKGPGAAAGVHQGDVLIGFDGHKITSIAALLATLGSSSVGRSVAISLRRGGATHEATLTIGSRPAA